MKNEIKERPILFNAEMVQAILSGKKTQTRRIMKSQPKQPCEGAYFDKYNNGSQWNWWTEDNKQYLGQIIKCPFGKVGDRLWVRETWNADWCEETIYKADGGSAIDAGYEREPKWKPSIHMPRWASRINLEITNIRVERLMYISEEDALSEGFNVTGWVPTYRDPDGGGETFTPRDNFLLTWEKIYGSKSIEENPWVWVIEFKKV